MARRTSSTRRSVRFSFKVLIPFFRSIIGSAISWTERKSTHSSRPALRRGNLTNQFDVVEIQFEYPQLQTRLQFNDRRERQQELLRIAQGYIAVGHLRFDNAVLFFLRRKHGQQFLEASISRSSLRSTTAFDKSQANRFERSKRTRCECDGPIRQLTRRMRSCAIGLSGLSISFPRAQNRSCIDQAIISL